MPRRAAFTFYKKLVSGMLDNKKEEYWAICPNTDCEWLKGTRVLRPYRMPDDQFEVQQNVSVFFALFYFIK